MLIKLDNISYGYNGGKVLERVNLIINPGDFIGMIGPNGGGKSTIIKIIMGLLEPWTGKITYGVNENGERIRAGYLPQYHEFDHKFPINVREVILSGLAGQGKTVTRFGRSQRKKAGNVAEKLGIGNIIEKSIGELSGGQMQRAFLGRALVADPEVLILDEPVTYVDSRFEAELYSLLEELNKTTAILLVSHDLGQITSTVKTIACVNKHLHYHPSNKIDEEVLATYNCPVELITHGRVPHRVLKDH